MIIFIVLKTKYRSAPLLHYFLVPPSSRVRTKKRIEILVLDIQKMAKGFKPMYYTFKNARQYFVRGTKILPPPKKELIIDISDTYYRSWPVLVRLTLRIIWCFWNYCLLSMSLRSDLCVKTISMIIRLGSYPWNSNTGGYNGPDQLQDYQWVH